MSDRHDALSGPGNTRLINGQSRQSCSINLEHGKIPGEVICTHSHLAERFATGQPHGDQGCLPENVKARYEDVGWVDHEARSAEQAPPKARRDRDDSVHGPRHQ